MVATLLTGQVEREGVAELLRPEPMADGHEPEERLILCGMSWDRYLALDKAFGDDRSGPRFYYLEGQLEIMTTSREHGRIKKWLGDFLGDYFMQGGLEILPTGQATMRLAMKQAGAEPDESWCIGEEKEFPDLVLEIALISGGLDKLEIYRRFEVPEVWIWRRKGVEIFLLRGEAGYERSARSQLLPKLDPALLNRCVAIRSWREARQAFRAGLTA